MKKILGLLALGLMIAAPLYLAGCDEGNGGTDTGTPDATDTVVDTADVPPDAIPDPVEDTSTDTGTEPEPDGACTPLLEHGTCHAVEQCGCSPGFACDIGGETTACYIYETCVAAGTREIEAECDALAQCPPGTSCLQYTGEPTGHCLQWCLTSADCDMIGRECNVPVSFTLPAPCTGSYPTAPYQVCSTDCPDDQDCGLPGSNTCATGETCIYDTTCDILVCRTAGTLAAGDDCSSGTGDCAEMLGCYTTDDGVTFNCYEFCDTSGTPACTTGTCNPFSTTGDHTDVGLCV